MVLSFDPRTEKSSKDGVLIVENSADFMIAQALQAPHHK